MSTLAEAVYSAITVSTQFVEANGIRFAYRRMGQRGKFPLVFNQPSFPRIKGMQAVQPQAVSPLT
ncbi:hypothetical protein [Acidicapsa acidisoli]|uniref:hypothetical protein n=1 Tax=Acidicapsa acidisoli TaxID=1615681 RepID=UPI0021E0AC41|nr:hypothetical protein [Acidicapsa acidisoli]